MTEADHTGGGHEHGWVARAATINDDGSYSITYTCGCGATKTEGGTDGRGAGVSVPG